MSALKQMVAEQLAQQQLPPKEPYPPTSLSVSAEFLLRVLDSSAGSPYLPGPAEEERAALSELMMLGYAQAVHPGLGSTTFTTTPLGRGFASRYRYIVHYNVPAWATAAGRGRIGAWGSP